MISKPASCQKASHLLNNAGVHQERDHEHASGHCRRGKSVFGRKERTTCSRDRCAKAGTREGIAPGRARSNELSSYNNYKITRYNGFSRPQYWRLGGSKPSKKGSSRGLDDGDWIDCWRFFCINGHRPGSYIWIKSSVRTNRSRDTQTSSRNNKTGSRNRQGFGRNQQDQLRKASLSVRGIGGSNCGNRRTGKGVFLRSSVKGA